MAATAAVGLAARAAAAASACSRPRSPSLCIEAFYRVAHLQGPESFDGWAFWTAKAKAIYFFGGLDEHLFRTLPGATYPILLPTLHAIAFHFMGSADTVTLHLQYWLLLVGFVGAVAGLLRPRAARSC